MLLIPIGFGILIGNIPFNMEAGLKIGIYEEGSVLNILYQGVTSGWYPPLIFLGIGAMTDFSALISNPKLMLIGAAAQFGIFGAYIIALLMGFEPNQAGAIGIIGGAGSKPDGCYCCISLFIHGIGSCYTTAHYASADHQKRACNPYETTKNRIPYRKSYFPNCRFTAYNIPCTFRSASAWYAVFR